MLEELVEAAVRVRDSAYAPYSGYRVGAALLDEEDRIHTGVNVENVSFGATICAERTAIVKMVSERGSRIKALAVATADGGAPCGICLQVLSEFADGRCQIVCVNDQGTQRSFELANLLPHGFRSDEVHRT